MASVIFDSTVLGVLVTVVVGHFFAIVKSRYGLVGEAVIASVGLVNKFGAFLAHALHAIVAGNPVGILGHAVVVVVGIRVANILTELLLVVTADRVIVGQLAIGAFVFFDIALCLLLS